MSLKATHSAIEVFKKIFSDALLKDMNITGAQRSKDKALNIKPFKCITGMIFLA